MGMSHFMLFGLAIAGSGLGCGEADPNDAGGAGGDGGSPMGGATSSSTSPGGGAPDGGAGGSSTGGSAAGGALPSWELRVTRLEFAQALSFASDLIVDPHRNDRVAIVFSGIAEGLGVWEDGVFRNTWDTTSVVRPRSWSFDASGDLYVDRGTFAVVAVHYIASGDTWVEVDCNSAPPWAFWWPPTRLLSAAGAGPHAALLGSGKFYDAAGAFGFFGLSQPLPSIDFTGAGGSEWAYVPDGSGDMYFAASTGEFGRCTRTPGTMSCATISTLPAGTVRLHVIPSEPNTVYRSSIDTATGDHALSVSFNGGATFAAVPGPPLEAGAVPKWEISPVNTKALVAWTAAQVFASSDLGETWKEWPLPDDSPLFGAGLDASGTLFVLANSELYSLDPF